MEVRSHFSSVQIPAIASIFLRVKDKVLSVVCINLALCYFSNLVSYKLLLAHSTLETPAFFMLLVSTKPAHASGPLHLLFLLIVTWLTLAHCFTLSRSLLKCHLIRKNIHLCKDSTLL